MNNPRREVRDLHRKLDETTAREERLEGSLSPWALTASLSPDPPRYLRDEDEATWKAREGRGGCKGKGGRGGRKGRRGKVGEGGEARRGRPSRRKEGRAVRALVEGVPPGGGAQARRRRESFLLSRVTFIASVVIVKV